MEKTINYRAWGKKFVACQLWVCTGRWLHLEKSKILLFFFSGSRWKGHGFHLYFCAQTSASWDLSQSVVQASVKKDGSSPLPDTQCETDHAKMSPGGIQNWPSLGPTTEINSYFNGWITEYLFQKISRMAGKTQQLWKIASLLIQYCHVYLPEEN